MKKIIEKIKYQERIKKYIGSGKYDLATLEHEAIVVISENEVKVYKHQSEDVKEKDD